MLYHPFSIYTFVDCRFRLTLTHILSSQWSEIQEFDVSDVEDELEKRLDNVHANDCCVLVYTVSQLTQFLFATDRNKTVYFSILIRLSFDSRERLEIQKV